MRLFVAAFPPQAVQEDLGHLLAGLNVGAAARRGTRVRRTPPQRWHVTLAFLGEVPDERGPQVEQALDRAVADGRPPGPVRLHLSGGGTFGRGRSTVLWVGVGGDVAGLTGLHREIRDALRAAGLPYDNRPFTPHLTVAFPGDRLDSSAVADDVDALDRHVGPGWTLERLVLVRSTITAAGGGYDVIRAWPVG